MRKIIIGTDGCSKCKMLSISSPDAELIKLPNDVLLALAKETNILSLPIVILSGSVDELEKVLN